MTRYGGGASHVKAWLKLMQALRLGTSTQRGDSSSITMAPNKGKARPAQPDDETSAPSQTRSTEELNLSVIRRHYPEVAGIHYVSPYAVLYAYMLETSQWEKVGMEGSLFVCELVPSPIGADRFAVILLNRRGLENFFMEITSPDDIDFGEFIMMQSDQVYGLWIFSEPLGSTANVSAEIQAKLKELAARAKSSREAKEREIESGMTEAEQVDTSVPMGRQVSLRELFGQRQTEAATIVQAHNNLYPPQPAQTDVLSQLFMKAKQDYNGFG
jgi:hypothetical protein